MRITKIELENFRCYERLKLELHPEFNLLVGVNASGKTTVLEALAIALSEWFGPLDAARRRLVVSDFRRVKRIDAGIPSLEIAEPTTVAAAAFMPAGNILEWTTRGNSDQPNTGTDAVRKARDALMPVPRRQARPDWPVFAAYDTQRLWRRSQHTSVVRDTYGGWHDAMFANANAGLLAEWMAWREGVRLQGISRAVENNLPVTSVREPLLEAVANAAIACLEGATRFYYSIDHQELRIDYADGHTLPFDLLSDGTRNLIALAGDIAWRAARLNPHHGADAAKKATGVVLIDEIDLHLHPAWQRRVIPDLRRAFPGIQFVATTHSPQVLSTAEPEWIRILHADGRVERVEHTRGRDSNSLLEDVFAVSERPEATRAALGVLFDLIDRGALDEAEARWAELRDPLGPDDPDIVRARTMLDLEKMPLLPDEGE